MEAPGTIRVGSGEPLVLVHGFSGIPALWRPILGRLEGSFDLLAVGLAGHVGGPELTPGTSPSVSALVDAIEGEMDACGFETAHIAGNSLGGWIALELARRGRARTVTAISPAGGWEAGSREERRLKALFTRNHAISSRALPYAHRLLTRPRLRRMLLSGVMAYGDRLDPASALEILRGSVECPIYFELMDGILRDGPPIDFEGVDCPVVLAWGTKDRILPEAKYAARMRRLLPDARWVELSGLGHIPMADDPALIAGTIEDIALQAQVDAVAHPAG